MIDEELVIAFIPARGGSKGLPGKNMLQINGKSLIQLAVESSRGDLIGTPVDVVVVSSDDQAILEHARELGCVNFERSEFAATDEATAADAIRDYFGSPDVMVDMADRDPWVLYLQPTSPGRTGRHVEEAFNMITPSIRSVVSVVAPEKSPYWTLNINASGRLSPLFPDAFNSNRQALPPAYIPNGAIYLFKLSDFMAAGSVPIDGAAAYIMSANESIDVDTQTDFDRAKALLER